VLKTQICVTRPQCFNHRGARGTSSEVGSRIPSETSVSSDHTTRRHTLQVFVILVCRRYCLVGCDFCSRSLRNKVVTSQITIVWAILKLSKPVTMSTSKYLPTFRKCILLSFIDQALNWRWAHYDSSKRRWLYRTSLDSSVGTVTTVLAGRFRSRGKKVSFSQNCPNRLWSPFPHLFDRHRGSFPGGKATRRVTLTLI